MSREREPAMGGRHSDGTVTAPIETDSAPVTDAAGKAGAEVDLGADPFDGDLAAELAARGSRRLVSRTTLALAGVVLVVGGFLGGVLVQKHVGGDSTSRFPVGAGQGPAGRGGFGGGLGGTGAGGGGTGGNGAGAGGANGGPGQGGQGGAAGTGAVTTGTVKLVDGTTVYLTTADGETVTVKTSGSTAVRIASAGSLGDLAAGATVTVQGTADADGIVTATELTGQK